ncbi:hypothetical protein MKW94_006910 [Papaver nudicaule]|uniref:Uncharacterized protein n=1 Tax=Papaver nudicaule TaxID=74823 RepID=A0AA41S0A9_PAPNU|nr:hypothetical protein [Papaver nudicaule]
MVDVQKAAGETAEYFKFYKSFCSNLSAIIWKPPASGSTNSWITMLTKS